MVSHLQSTILLAAALVAAAPSLARAQQRGWGGIVSEHEGAPSWSADDAKSGQSPAMLARSPSRAARSASTRRPLDPKARPSARPVVDVRRTTYFAASSSGLPGDSYAPLPGIDPAMVCQALARISRDLDIADRMLKDGNPHCVDLYFWSAIRAWRLFGAIAGPDESAFLDAAPAPGHAARAQELYHRALAQLIAAGQKLKRLDPHSHLSIDDQGTRRRVPIACYGLPWKPEDYCELLPSDDFHSSRINQSYAAPGWGTPLVAVRVLGDDEQSAIRRLPFTVTAILRPTGSDAAPLEDVLFGQGAPGCPATLELYNPRVFDKVEIAGRQQPLAYDLTAPLAMLQNTAQPLVFEGFVRPDNAQVQPELIMLEPYQPGKFPVVFIHGLYSDPLAWTNAANELMARRDLYARFQFWAFSYPTGGDFLESAASFRDDLVAAREGFDPERQDPALDNMVFVTHSLGGLMAKLQITSSEDLIWRRMANAPLDAVRASPDVKASLARLVYFEPSPSVKRVVFMGTPFKGSSWALRSVGRVSSGLVRFTGPTDSDYQLLMQQNRDIFAPYLRRSRPTTVDMLEPDSAILLALQQMPINPVVRLHTIIGDGAWRVLREPSDGIVTVDSAHHPHVDSELFVPTIHTQLHNFPQAIEEVARILHVHLAECGTGGAGPVADGQFDPTPGTQPLPQFSPRPMTPELLPPGQPYPESLRPGQWSPGPAMPGPLGPDEAVFETGAAPTAGGLIPKLRRLASRGGRGTPAAVRPQQPGSGTSSIRSPTQPTTTPRSAEADVFGD